LRWTFIKALLHNQVIKISYLVVIGLPIFIEIAQGLKLVPSITGSVYDIFFSGILLLILVLLYGVFAPEEIRHYENIHDYITKNHAELLIAYPDMKKQIVMAHLDDVQETVKGKIIDFDRKIRQELNLLAKKSLELSLDALLTPLYPGCINRYLQKKWDKANRSKNWVALAICLAIAAIAAALAIWVFYLRIKIVIDYKTLNQ
jgi:hypothetical protein